MELRNQLISDIEILPEEAVTAISAVVRQYVILASKAGVTARPVRRPFQFGCMEGQIRVPDDFNEPMEDFKEYM